MADFSFDDDDREEWAAEAEAAAIAAAAATRSRISKKLSGKALPARARGLWRQSWWEDEVDGTLNPAFSGIGAAAANRVDDGLGFGLSDAVKAAAVAGVVGPMLQAFAGYGDTVRDRVLDLHKQASADGWDPERLSNELGLDGEGGPLSDALAAAMGLSAAYAVIEGSGVATVNASDRTGMKTWRTMDDERVRPEHADAEGQSVAMDEDFDIGGYPAQYPGDDQLPPELSVNCRCALEYDIEPTETSDSEGDVDTELAADMAAFADRLRAAAFAVDPGRVTVTVEPTSAEKQALALVADDVAQLHVPLLDVLDAASFTPDDRVAVGTALANAAALTPPLSGTISGVGWLAEKGVTVGIIDCPGLSALRASLADALYDIAPEPGEFLPVIVLSAGSLDATTIAGTPVHFNELRLRVGTETLVFDLLGPLPSAPPAEAPAPEAAPAAPSEPAPVSPQEAPAMPTTTASRNTNPAAAVTKITFADPVAPPTPDSAPPPPSGDAPLPPAPALVDVTDDDLETEIAQRVADAAAVAVGGAPEDFLDDATEEVKGAIAEMAAELQAGAAEPAEPADTSPPMLPGPGAASVTSRDVFADTPADATGPAADLTSYTDTDLEAEVARRAAEVAAAASGATADDLMAEATQEATGMIAELAGEVTAEPDDGVVAEDHPHSPMMATEETTFADGDLVPDETEPGQAFDWEGVLALEDTPTSDGRMFSAGALVWRTLPLTLALQTVTAPGHDGAVVCGSIVEIERVGNTIVGRGRFSATESGTLARTLIGEGSLKGVSIDVAGASVIYTDESGAEVTEDDLWTGNVEGMVTAVFVEAELMGATLTPWPAFAETSVGLLETALVATGAPGCWTLTGPALFHLNTDTEALVASAAPSIPAPSADLFNLKPDTDEPWHVGKPLPDGTIPCYGVIAYWGECHIGFDGKCVTPPRNDDFSSFYVGSTVLTAEGTLLPTGVLFMDTVHPDLRKSASDAQAHYADTGCAVADVRLYNGEHGIVAAGVLRPNVDEITAYRLRGSRVSGDWRPTRNGLRMAAILAVNAGGFGRKPMVEGIAASAGKMRPWVRFGEDGEAAAMVAVGAPQPSAVEVANAELEARLADLEARVAAMGEPHPTLLEAEADDGPVELSADERMSRATAALSVMGVPTRAERLTQARAALGLCDTCS